MTLKLSIMLTGSSSMHDYGWMAREIEGYGFDELHIADDLIMRPAWPILTLIGHHTERIKLGPAIVTPKIAHPVYHATNLAALDELTGGRAICGVGRGGLNTLIGIEKPYKTTLMLREAITVMRKVIARDPTPFTGEFFSTTGELLLHQQPVRSEIPIFIGTWGPRISQLGGEIATGIKADCVADPGYLGKLRENVHIGAERAGREPSESEIIVGPLCSISMDRPRAVSTMKLLLAIFLPFTSPMKEAHGIDDEQIRIANTAYLEGNYEKAEACVPDKAVQVFSLTGTPGDIIPRIEALVDAGATHVAFGPPLGPDFEESIRLLGKKVVPYFRSNN